ncbi:hypothetical protein [Flexibacterium corallicola]|uniref:hypothetical protein n=1 Tax=Flexibacterium corallicola TaxID=3037259 RepID=UPI00286F65F7|nr:hypothetical protein [Pseudovibrio sp. M1P-2-3]
MSPIALAGAAEGHPVFWAGPLQLDRLAGAGRRRALSQRDRRILNQFPTTSLCLNDPRTAYVLCSRKWAPIGTGLLGQLFSDKLEAEPTPLAFPDPGFGRRSFHRQQQVW